MIEKIKNLKLAVIGLGYVGLPLALEFSKKKHVIGFDINKNRIKQLKSGVDKNLEFNKQELQEANYSINYRCFICYFCCISISNFILYRYRN